MIKIFLPYIYGLSEALEPLATLQRGTKFPDVFVKLYTAQTQLEALLTGSVFAGSLRSCRAHGAALVSAIKAVTSNLDDFNREIKFSEVIDITNQASLFKTSMLAELGVFPTYFVTQKGGFDTLTLLDWGYLIFPDDLQQKVPEAKFDAEQAAKALAFELPTAAGFHVFRATESILRRYYDYVTSGQGDQRLEASLYMFASCEWRNVGTGDTLHLRADGKTAQKPTYSSRGGANYGRGDIYVRYRPKRDYRDA